MCLPKAPLWLQFALRWIIYPLLFPVEGLPVRYTDAQGHFPCPKASKGQDQAFNLEPLYTGTSVRLFLMWGRA